MGLGALGTGLTALGTEIGADVGAASAAVSSGLAGASGAIGGLAADAGIAGTAISGLAGAIGTGITGAGVGAGLGAGEAAITGGNIGTGALTGGITGGTIGAFGGELGDITGLGAAGGNAIAGAAGGAIGSGVTGGNPLTGALGGAASGLVSGSLGGLTSNAPGVAASGDWGNLPVGGASNAAATLGATSGAAATPGPSAASVAAPTSIATATPDLTSSAGTGVSGDWGNLPAGGPVGAANVLGATSSGSPLSGGVGPGGAASTASALGSTPSGVGGTGGAAPSAGSAASTLGATPSDSGDWGNLKMGDAVGGSPASGGGLFDKVGNFLSGPNGKLAGAGIAGIGLLKDLMGNQTVKGTNQISQLAGQEAAQGSLLQGYLTSGTLPPAIQASVNAATKDGITAIKAKYAGQGVAPGSSAEINDIARLQQNSVIQGATLADQLLQQGISETQLSGQLYQDLVKANTEQNQQTGSAITALASALAGGGTKIQLGGGTSSNG